MIGVAVISSGIGFVFCDDGMGSVASAESPSACPEGKTGDFSSPLASAVGAMTGGICIVGRSGSASGTALKEVRSPFMKKSLPAITRRPIATIPTNGRIISPNEGIKPFFLISRRLDRTLRLRDKYPLPKPEAAVTPYESV
ncbi:MAG: hypothetical protein K5841_09615 [Fretibacterium sp.]|nr:hypothetical protein [Fretibacterium sp.]